MDSCQFEDWILTPHRLAVHAPTATAVIADVHLGYREARQDSGEAIPLLDVATQLTPLRRARKQISFDRLVVAGDLFERRVRQDLLDDFLRELEALGVTLAALVPGNHDRGWEDFCNRIPIYPAGIGVGAWHIIHGDKVDPGRRVVLGHWHPIVRRQGRRAPCYMVGKSRLVLPAFSADAAGQARQRYPEWADLQAIRIAGGKLVAPS